MTKTGEWREQNTCQRHCCKCHQHNSGTKSPENSCHPLKLKCKFLQKLNSGSVNVSVDKTINKLNLHETAISLDPAGPFWTLMISKCANIQISNVETGAINLASVWIPLSNHTQLRVRSLDVAVATLNQWNCLASEP